MVRLDKIKRMFLPMLLIGMLLFGLLVVTALGFHWYYTGQKPGQPIGFSHHLHIETVGLACTHCHQYAEQSAQATVPAMHVCMKCHETTATGRPEIKKLVSYWEKREPIPWNKVHRQAWHVYFTHKRHIKAGFDCVQCHGEVRAMTTVRKVRSLEMGWCLTCHRENQASTDCLTCHK